MSQMIQKFKSIPTYYNGIRFRSRLEARWAIFFEYLRISYRYEYEGFDLDGAWYVPDFFLPKLDCFIEVKPFKPSEKEQNKCQKLAKATKKSAFLFWDIPRKWEGHDGCPAYAWTRRWDLIWIQGMIS